MLVRSTDWKIARSSPTQRKYFVCNYCFAGARHDIQGRLIETFHPDRGVTKTVYDKYDRVRFIQNAAQRALGGNRFSAKIYDDQGREIAAVEVNGHPFDSPDTEISPSNYIPYNRTIYGKPTEEVLNSCGVAINTTLLDY
ncbi:MAG TPA: hypothetical protein VJ083_03885, partial [Sedimentibacter sp.]|nr:hypothetical protein [Sedimentibacter sp.]